MHVDSAVYQDSLQVKDLHIQAGIRTVSRELMIPFVV